MDQETGKTAKPDARLRLWEAATRLLSANDSASCTRIHNFLAEEKLGTGGPLGAAYMQDACWGQARKSRPALGCKDASKSDWLTQVDLLGSGAISFPDILNGVQPYVIAAGLHKHQL